MTAETSSGCGRDTLRRILRPPSSSARTRVTHVERCKVATSSAIGGGVCGPRWMCAHHVPHVHPFLFLLYSRGAYPSHIRRIYEVINDGQAKPKHACALQQPHRRRSRPTRQDGVGGRGRSKGHIFDGACTTPYTDSAAATHTHTTNMHEEREAKTEDNDCTT